MVDGQFEKFVSGEELTDTFDQRVFTRTQEIQQHSGEPSEALHERLRPYIRNSFVIIERPTKIKTPSWYTFDASAILGENTVVLSTSTCKHETSIQLFVGVRQQNFRKQIPKESFEYTLYPFSRNLTNEEKDLIYDTM